MKDKPKLSGPMINRSNMDAKIVEKHDLFVGSEYIEGKRPTHIAKTLGISVAHILEVLDNVKRRCLWPDKKS